MKKPWLFLALVWLALAKGPASADEFPVPENRGAGADELPLPAEQAAAGFKLPPGFKANVFAAEPDAQNPVAMAWDGKGRLWVAECYTYGDRTTKYDLTLRDRVLILADTDGDGRADQRKVFCDNVQRLMSVEVGLGGVWLICLPHLLFIPDANGDDVPDAAPEVVLDGFGISPENYHNCANGLRWGPDGWLYGRCGASSPGQIGPPGSSDQERVPIFGGLWRYHPRRKVFETLCHGTTNPWGHDWDAHGELFFTNTVTGHLFHMIPGAHYTRTLPQDAADALEQPRGESRPEYYDFDLFRQTEETRALDDRLLSQLSYTVFDTETTGLDPSAGDEIIQIGATRIVNGRLLRNESFDQLVDPRRHLDADSVRIHGITEAMLRGRPTIDQLLPSFHEFCEDTVLVAHNAAFDMRFLQLKEATTGIAFRQPVLDTLLLSAVIHPNQESHRLEAIAERLGVNVIGRHTALGDAIVTGEVFLKMIPLLEHQGIRTLREAREAAERSYYARVEY